MNWVRMSLSDELVLPCGKYYGKNKKGYTVSF